MNFTATFSNAYLVFCLAFLVLVRSLPTDTRDVFVPHILAPAQGDIWVVGQSCKVIWNVSSIPVHITNPNGMIYLRKGDFTLMNMALADKFDIRLGSIMVKVPAVVSGRDYSVVLFGDSGNFSPRFSIETD